MDNETKKQFTGKEVVETEQFVFFWKPPAVFGQWTPSKFFVDDVKYCCAEQYMMSEKARLFKDVDMAEQIMKTDDPFAHKKLGKKVKNFNQKTWEERRFDIVVNGNIAKFKQNPEMKAILLATDKKILVEASPFDNIWGVGLRADDERILNPVNWRGKNLLGKALMVVRDLLDKAERGKR